MALVLLRLYKCTVILYTLQTYNLHELMDMMPKGEHDLVYSIQEMTGVDDLAVAARVTIVLRGMDPEIVQVCMSFQIFARLSLQNAWL